MEDMYRVSARDSVALTLAVNKYSIRRDLWLGDRYIDLDVEKFGSSERDRFFVLIKSVSDIAVDVQDFHDEAKRIQRSYGVKTLLAVVKVGGAEMLVDARLKQRMAIDEDRFTVRSFGRPEPEPSIGRSYS